MSDLFDDVDPHADTEMIRAQDNDRGCLLGLALMAVVYAAGVAIVLGLLQLFL